jgi:hypothetical protein
MGSSLQDRFCGFLLFPVMLFMFYMRLVAFLLKNWCLTPVLLVFNTCNIGINYLICWLLLPIILVISTCNIVY